MAENTKMTDDNVLKSDINSKNIFEEFDWDNLNLIDEVEKLKFEAEKDIYYYLNIVWKILGYIFWILFILWVVFFSYIKIQSNDSMSNKWFLDPFCWFILSEVPNPKEYLWCSSISSVKKYYTNELDGLKKSQSSKLLPILNLVYENENFLKSKEILFVLNKSNNKFKVLDAISSFDKLKNEYVWIYNKNSIVCNNLSLDWVEKIFTLKCEAFSSDFDNNIIWFSWRNNELISWTSISLANSFLNFIEKKWEKFTLIDRQKVFSSTSVTGGLWYTNKTSFDVKLKINF
jgi:hypothetical protein